MTYTHDEKAKALRREIAMRQRVYPNLVAQGRMDAAEANRQIGVFQAILEDYQSTVPLTGNLFAEPNQDTT